MAGVSKHWILTSLGGDTKYADADIPPVLYQYFQESGGMTLEARRDIVGKALEIRDMPISWRAKMNLLLPLVPKRTFRNWTLKEYRVYPNRKRETCPFRKIVSNFRYFKPRGGLKPKRPKLDPRVKQKEEAAAHFEEMRKELIDFGRRLEVPVPAKVQVLDKHLVFYQYPALPVIGAEEYLAKDANPIKLADIPPPKANR